jgi:glycosyltransferase involved in cell wall biosynthesis
VAAAALLPVAYGMVLWQARLAGLEAFQHRSLLVILVHLLTSGGVILAALTWRGSLLAPLLVVLAVPAAVNLAVTLRDLRRTPAGAPVEKGVVRYGRRSTLYSVLGIAAQHVDKLLLFFLSPVEVAIYAAVARLDALVKGVSSDMAAVLSPGFAREPVCPPATDRFLKRLSAGVSVLIVLFALSVLPLLLRFVYGEAYAAAIPYAQATLLSLSLTTLNNFRQRYIRSHLDEESLRFIQTRYAALRIGVAVVAVPALGIAGAVAATYASRLLMFVYVNRIFRERYLKPVEAARASRPPVPAPPAPAPLVTLGITAYNAEETIERAVRSARAQSWPALEIVIADDASTDQTPRLLEALAGEDGRIRVLPGRENQGPAAARNRILAAARGEFLAFLDDDDECYPERLAGQYARLIEVEARAGDAPAACYATTRKRYANGAEIVSEAIGSREAVPRGQVVADYLLLGERASGYCFGAGVPANALFLRTAVLREAGGFDPAFRRVEDADLAVRLALAGAWFAGTPQELLLQHATGGPEKSAEANLTAELQLVEKHREYLERKDLYGYAARWPYLRYYHFTRRRVRLLGALLSLSWRYPLRAPGHFVASARRRRRREEQMKRGPA